jgi:hypothetical protein
MALIATDIGSVDRRPVDAFVASKEDEEVWVLQQTTAVLPKAKKKTTTDKAVRVVVAFMRRHLLILREGKGKVLLTVHYCEVTDVQLGALDITITTSSSKTAVAATVTAMAKIAFGSHELQ